MDNVSHMDTGFNGWKEDGFPVVSYDDWKATQAND